MRMSIGKYILTLTALMMSGSPLSLTAQDAAGQERNPVHYNVINLGTLGGSFSEALGINNKGWVPGFSTLQGDQSYHATLWTREQGLQDLGTLGGSNSSVNFEVKDNRGAIVGGSDTATIDPYQEAFCGNQAGISVSDPYICRGFRWKNGIMTPLPTLGGNNSIANDVNDKGQIVGAAEPANPDPNCISPQVFDFEAVLWGPQEGQIQELPLLPSDVAAYATVINDNGQVAGAAGPICAQPPVALSISDHIVLWENGTVTNLGSLGGLAGNLPFAMNNRGDIVGESDISGDTATHAFLWTKEQGMQDLGTLSSNYVGSIAFGINNKGQIVGGVGDANGNGPAVLWQNAVATDLNTLICGASSLYLIFGSDINDRGEIVGQAIDADTGALVSFLATPTQSRGCEANTSAEQMITLHEKVREQVHQRGNLSRFGHGVFRPQ